MRMDSQLTPNPKEDIDVVHFNYTYLLSSVSKPYFLFAALSYFVVG